MKTVRTVEALRREVAAARQEAGSTVAGLDDVIGFVPTMGYLHEGHLSLVDRARDLTDYVVLSIFVNPTQFGPGEDYEEYPRDPERDAGLAEARGVDLVFAPDTGEVYPEAGPSVKVVPGPLAERLCGLSRPGHFQGVLTVVAKLFGMVQPDVAVFGRKDYQQAVLIRRMARDLNMPVRVEMAPIVREDDGLALSSRNQYLSALERERARSLSAGLFAARSAFAEEDVTNGDRLKARVRGTMRDADVEPEYIELVHPETLDSLDEAREGAVLAVAARVGETRLIDNVRLERQS
ncbi:MAG: pantoate--beta-alanine ligase [Longimicrobiales bacterium]|nr:pantoate--beta-alanine ligase [Longimicrobiales bacterium]